MECQSIMNELKLFESIKDAKNKQKYLRAIMIVSILYIILIVVGTIVFTYMFDITWLDALYTSSLIITAVDLEVTVTTDGQKIFIIIYSIIAVLLFLSMANLSVKYLFDLYM